MKEYTNLDYFEDFLIENLPHGSGIDYKWEIEFLKNGKIRCYNGYHHLNENGFYDAHLPFYITIFKNGESNIDFDLHFCGLSSHWYKLVKYGLREYLKDTLYYSLSNIENELVKYFNGGKFIV